MNLPKDTIGPPEFTLGPHQIRTWSIGRVPSAHPQEER
jgi:hypothetical protein